MQLHLRTMANKGYKPLVAIQMAFSLVRIIYREARQDHHRHRMARQSFHHATRRIFTFDAADCQAVWKNGVRS